MSGTEKKPDLKGILRGLGCLAATAAVAMLAGSTGLAEPFEQTSPEALVNALQGVYGPHPGFRKNHAKGTCATGSFVGLPETTSYTRSALFSGATVPVVARFSPAVVTRLLPTPARGRAAWRWS